MTWKRPDEDRPRHGQLVLMRGPQGGLFLGRFVGDTDTARTNDSMCRRRCAWWQEIPEENMQMKVKLDRGAYLPERAHATDAGADIRTPVSFVLAARSSHTVNTGVHIQIPSNTKCDIRSKSGLNINHDIISEGLIDEGFSGEIRVRLHNLSDEPYTFNRGDKITQIVVTPVYYPEFEKVEAVEGGERGEAGIGSTGR